MGDHLKNPRAIGNNVQLPDVMPQAEVQWLVVPTAAFLSQVEEMRAAGVEGPITCREQDRDVVMVAIAKWVVPQRTVDPRQGWPMSQIQMAELARMPLTDFKRQHKANFEAAGLKHCADSIVMAEDGKLTEA